LTDPAPTTRRPLQALLTTLTLVALLLALAIGLAPNLDTRAVQLGERLWPGYAADLRVDPTPPECDPEEVAKRAERCVEAPAPQPAGDPFAEEDPFADEEDPFADDAEAPAGENCAAVRNLRDTCDLRHAAFATTSERLTPGVRRFRAVELAVSALAQFPYSKHLLVILVILGALTTTGKRMHIALRSPATLLEYRLSQGGQLAAHALWLWSCLNDVSIQRESSAEADDPMLSVLWIAGFALLGALNLRHLAAPPDTLSQGPQDKWRLPMVIPLYVYMALIGGAYFLGVESHDSGQAIFLHKFVQHPTIYIGIGLYIWAGMMLSRTRLAPLSFDVLLPWGLPPVLLAWLVVVLAAFPTAYSGASGIFVIAAGAVIFERLTAAGATPRVALAATAMSGSLGVVLRPCLVVVLVAVLNKQVTTDELFHHGLWVFALTAALSLVAFLLWNRDPIALSPPRTAARLSARALLPLAPYGGLALLVIVVAAVVFKTPVNEHTAPLVLPVVMIALLAYDRLTTPARDVLGALTSATGEATHHVGALLMVMAGSVGLGGVVERSEVMALVPASFGSVWITMTVLVVIMVVVGMTMDALGAVVLVSVTVATVAYDNGIDPAHFWMVVLVGFELGYLTPPVSLNHLLARQVIGPAAAVEVTDPRTGFWERYEHLLVPMIIMGTALVIVAYGPLFFY